jgi:hypothetical protein
MLAGFDDKFQTLRAVGSSDDAVDEIALLLLRPQHIEEARPEDLKNEVENDVGFVVLKTALDEVADAVELVEGVG